MLEGESLGGKRQVDVMFCEKERDSDLNIEKYFQVTIGQRENQFFFFINRKGWSRVLFVLVLFFVIIVVYQFQEISEDEGIYGYGGSDLRDNMLGGSDDFGLNGVRLVV